MSENIVSYTSEELAEKRLRGESLTDWQRVTNATEQEIEEAIAADPDAEEITDEDWENGEFVVSLRLNTELMAWLQSQEESYQDHIQRLIREAMQQKSKL